MTKLTPIAVITMTFSKELLSFLGLEILRNMPFGHDFNVPMSKCTLVAILSCPKLVVATHFGFIFEFEVLFASVFGWSIR
jgi:hypothetical protein